MKVRLLFKSPESLYEATKVLKEEDQQALERLSTRWLKWGEILTIEIDTEEETCKVVEL